MINVTDSIRAAAVAAAVHEVTAVLLRRHGPVMDAPALAALLGIKPSALRMRRVRGAALPKPFDDKAQWSTAQVALWLVGIYDTRDPSPQDPSRKVG